MSAHLSQPRINDLAGQLPVSGELAGNRRTAEEEVAMRGEGLLRKRPKRMTQSAYRKGQTSLPEIVFTPPIDLDEVDFPEDRARRQKGVGPSARSPEVRNRSHLVGMDSHPSSQPPFPNPPSSSAISQSTMTSGNSLMTTEPTQRELGNASRTSSSTSSSEPPNERDMSGNALDEPSAGPTPAEPSPTQTGVRPERSASASADNAAPEGSAEDTTDQPQTLGLELLQHPRFKPLAKFLRSTYAHVPSEHRALYKRYSHYLLTGGVSGPDFLSGVQSDCGLHPGLTCEENNTQLHKWITRYLETVSVVAELRSAEIRQMREDMNGRESRDEGRIAQPQQQSQSATRGDAIKTAPSGTGQRLVPLPVTSTH